MWYTFWLFYHILLDFQYLSKIKVFPSADPTWFTFLCVVYAGKLSLGNTYFRRRFDKLKRYSFAYHGSRRFLVVAAEYWVWVKI